MNGFTDGREMAAYREEEDPFEEDIVFDQAGLLNNTSKMNSAIRRVSSGKCALFAKTLGLCGAFFGLGLCVANPGPVFLSPFHPAMESDNGVVHLSNIYVARTCGYVIGALIGAVLFDRFNRLFLLFVSLLLTSIFITVAPWCQTVILEVGMVMLGITMGFLDTGGNVLCLDLWGRNSGPFMQAMHFSFGLGAFVAPLLAAPFLDIPLVDTSLSTEFSNVITEYPVQLEDPKGILFREDRVKRGTEYTGGLSDTFSDEIIRNLSNPVFMDNIFNVTDSVSVNPLSFSSSSIFSTDADGISSSPRSTSAKPRVPKRKPSKTDASKLGTKDWDKVHVGIPPASDLLPMMTSSTPVPSAPSAPTQSFSSGSAATEPYGNNSQSTSIASSISVSSTDPEAPINTNNSGTFVEHELVVSENVTPGADGISMPYKSSTPSPPSFVTQPPKASSSVETSRETFIDGTAFLRNNSSTSLQEPEYPVKEYSSKDSTDYDLKELNEAKDKSDKYGSDVIFLRRNENISDLSSVPAPARSSEKSSDGSVSEFIRKNNLLNSLLLKSDNQNFSSTNTKVSNTVSLLHTVHSSFRDIQSLPPSPSPVEKGLNVSGDGKMGTLASFALKSDDDIPSEKNAATPDSVPFMTQSLQGHVVSDSPVEITSTLSSKIPVLGHSHHVHHKPGTFDNDTEHINTIFDMFANRVEKYGFNKIQFTYLIVGIIVFSISLVFLGFLCHNPRDPKSKQEGLGGKKITNYVVHKVLVLSMAFIFFLYMGLEVTYGHLIVVFSNVQLSVVFWGSFTAMRFASIFFASGFSPLTMLILNFVFCTFGTVLVTFVASILDTALWVGTALIGMGLASMFPTGVLWIEQYIHITNQVAAHFVIGVAVGEVICPFVIYKLMAIERMIFLYAALFMNALCIIMFSLMWWIASHRGEKYIRVNSNGYQLANQNDEEEDMMDMSPSGSGAVQRCPSLTSEHRSLLNGNIHRGP